jgi:hypothetical protein
MKALLGRTFILAAALSTVTLAAPAQTATPEKGFTAIEAFQGEVNSTEKTLKLDSNIGYDFNKHFGVFAGVPFYFTSTPSTSATTTTTATTGGTVSGIGNAYLGFALRAPNPKLNYASVVTAGAPTGDTSKGLSSGRATVDWSNHFDRSFNRLTPFFDAGLANTVPDTMLQTRAFTSLGAVSHLQEGAEFELAHHFSAGGAAYQIFPFGTQKVFSKVTSSGPGPGAGTATASGKGGHGAFQDQFLTTGTGLTRENGVNTWVALEPSNHFWRAELGFSRSMTFDLNSFIFNLGLNIGKMVRSRTTGS